MLIYFFSDLSPLLLSYFSNVLKLIPFLFLYYYFINFIDSLYLDYKHLLGCIGHAVCNRYKLSSIHCYFGNNSYPIYYCYLTLLVCVFLLSEGCEQHSQTPNSCVQLLLKFLRKKMSYMRSLFYRNLIVYYSHCRLHSHSLPLGLRQLILCYLLDFFKTQGYYRYQSYLFILNNQNNLLWVPSLIYTSLQHYNPIENK